MKNIFLKHNFQKNLPSITRIILSTIAIITLVTPAPNYAFITSKSLDLQFLKSAHPVLALTVGRARADVGENTSFADIDNNLYFYNAHKTHDTVGLWGGFIGAEAVVNNCIPLNLQLGLAYYQLSSVTQKGILTQGPAPGAFDDFPFQFDMQSSQLLLESKLLWTFSTNFHPYLSLGLGAAFNRADNYQVVYPIFLTFTPLFDNQTTSSFSYSLGLGIDVDVWRSLRLGLGYRFADFGETELGNGMIDNIPTTHTLQQSHLYTQSFLLQLTYVIV